MFLTLYKYFLLTKDMSAGHSVTSTPFHYCLYVFFRPASAKQSEMDGDGSEG